MKATVDPLGHKFEHEVTVVSIADASEVEGGRVFRDKEILKLSISFLQYKTGLNL